MMCQSVPFHMIHLSNLGVRQVIVNVEAFSVFPYFLFFKVVLAKIIKKHYLCHVITLKLDFKT